MSDPSSGQNVYDTTANMTRNALINDAVRRASTALREGRLEDAAEIILAPKIVRAQDALLKEEGP